MVYLIFGTFAYLFLFKIVQPLVCKIVTRLFRPSFWAGWGILVKMALNRTVYFDQILHSYTFFWNWQWKCQRKEKNIKKKMPTPGFKPLCRFKPLCIGLLDYLQKSLLDYSASTCCKLYIPSDRNCTTLTRHWHRILTMARAHFIIFRDLLVFGRTKLFAYWVIFHTFLSSADFFNQFCR